MKNTCLVLWVAMTVWHTSSAQYPYLEIKVPLGEKEYRVSTEEMKLDFNNSSKMLNIKFDLKACRVERVIYDSIHAKRYIPHYNQSEYQGKMISAGVVTFTMGIPEQLRDTTFYQSGIVYFQNYETKIESIKCDIRQAEDAWLFTLSFEEMLVGPYYLNTSGNGIKVASSFYIKSN